MREATMDNQISYLKAVEKQLLWQACWMVHHANHIRPKGDGRCESRWSSGILRIHGIHHDRSLFQQIETGRSRCGETPCIPCFSCDALPDGKPDTGSYEKFPRLWWTCNPIPAAPKMWMMLIFHTGSVWSWRRRHRLCIHGTGLYPCPP